MKGFFKGILSVLKFLLIICLIIFVVIVLFIGGVVLYSNIKDKEFDKYNGHGFEYMHGYSSTDFSGYHVYDGEKLVELDHQADLYIEDVNEMPILDGAEACYPIYSAVAKSIYKDIDVIEKDIIDRNQGKKYSEMSDEDFAYILDNGKIVTFTNSKEGYNRLIEGKVDLFFGARPSNNQKEYAKDVNERIISIPIGKEAFVFFVEKDNPIDNLSSDDVRKIYSGEITNWSELGGKNQKIMAFQRPEDSGSQVMMRYFMNDVPLKEAETIEKVNAMGMTIKAVKQYHSEKGAIAYTFNYFLTGLNQEKDVKILSIDGIYPSIDSIKDGSYPILANLVCAKLESNKKENVDSLIDFLLSDDGQYIIEKTGYGPLVNRERIEIIEE